MTSVTCQRYVLNITLSVVSVSLSTSGTAAQILLGWVEGKAPTALKQGVGRSLGQFECCGFVFPDHIVNTFVSRSSIWRVHRVILSIHSLACSIFWILPACCILRSLLSICIPPKKYDDFHTRNEIFAGN